MKILNGSDIALFVKERQAGQVRNLNQQHKIQPKLAIIKSNPNSVIETYVNLKQKYGNDIGVEVEIYNIDENMVSDLISKLNHDDGVHGVIIQLPLVNKALTDEYCRLVEPSKDVDALGSTEHFDPATPMAILWLLAGYNIDLKDKHIVLVGNGKLVGKPLHKMLTDSNYNVTLIDIDTPNPDQILLTADVIITATGTPGLIKSEVIPPKCVVIDAGVAVDSGKLRGDLDENVYTRDDLSITPTKGGVGPLTVSALFDNVIRSARNKSHKK